MFRQTIPVTLNQEKYWCWPEGLLSLLRDTPIVSISNSPCSQFIAFTRFSENITSNLEIELTEIRTCMRFLKRYTHGINFKILGDFLLELLHCKLGRPCDSSLDSLQ